MTKTESIDHELLATKISQRFGSQQACADAAGISFWHLRCILGGETVAQSDSVLDRLEVALGLLYGELTGEIR